MFHILAEATTTGGGDLFSMLLPLILMFGIFYFILIRPENKRKKEAEQTRNSLKNGDKVTTIGGITGVIVDVKDDKFVIETGADRVRIEFMKWGLSTNDSATERAKEEAKKAADAKAKEKAAKKAEKGR